MLNGALLACSLAAAPVPLTIWSMPEPETGALYGTALAFAGPVLAVGASRAPSAAGIAGAGAVFLHDADPDSPDFGALIGRLDDPSARAGADFGAALAILEDGYLAVGAPKGGAQQQGVVHIFDVQPERPSFGSRLVTLANPRPSAGDQFGFALAGIGDRLLVGAFWEAGSGPDGSGAVYLYAATPAASSPPGELLHTYDNPQPAAADMFGVSVVSIDAGRIAVGAFRDDSGAVDAGSVYLYDLPPDAGTSALRLDNPDPTPTNAMGQNDEFGHALASDGKTLYISAFRDDLRGEDAGTVYGYDIDPESPRYGERVVTLPALLRQRGANFGFALLAPLRQLLVGAWRESAVAGYWNGAAYGLRPFAARSEGFIARLAPASRHFRQFGSALALTPDCALLAVGAVGDGDSVAGAVHLYAAQAATP